MTMRRGRGEGGRRGSISVVVPFAGTASESKRLFTRLDALSLAAGDEVIVADNSGLGLLAPAGSEARVVAASAERSSYHARNAGAEAAVNEWVLFLDADCEPGEGLLDRFFEAPIAGRTGAIGGRIETAPGASLAARWARSRGNVDQLRNLSASRSGAATGNLLVRREAWEEIGGFCEGIVSGGDLELCWRLVEAGWEISYCDRATVVHPPKASLPALARQLARWGAGNAWQERRIPGSSAPPPLLGPVARTALAAAAHAVRLRRERARLAAVDGLAACARGLGRLRGNASPRPRADDPGDRAIAIYAERFPAVSETFVASEARALARLGWRVRVEAAARPLRPLLGGAREFRVDYLEDEGRADRVRAAALLVARHPLRCLHDLASRGRWPERERMPLRGIAPLAERLERLGDRHLRVHFAGPAATHALRAGRLAGVPVDVATHGYDVFAAPSGLDEKLAAASFVTVPCDYMESELRAALPGRDLRLERIVMGVDGERFRREGPRPDERRVLAIGRFVEKKGFAHLIEAAALLGSRGEGIELTIAGEGPLRDDYARLIAGLGLEASVELESARGATRVRALLERADLLVVPSVVARDGDRDTMPVVAKEALAMEVPVVATEVGGLPEMIAPEWGRLVPPADPAALAEAIAELLALDPRDRDRMGRAGRAFAVAELSVSGEAERLAELIGHGGAHSMGVR